MFCKSLANLATTLIVRNHQISLFNPLIEFGCQQQQIYLFKRHVTSLSPTRIKELLSANETQIKSRDKLPSQIDTIECNQLASNNPIEDRLRISSIQLPGFSEPTLVIGVFDGHGGGTTASIISRRLFNYIVISLHPEPSKLNLADNELDGIVVDLHNLPNRHRILDPNMTALELEMLNQYKNEPPTNNNVENIAANLRSSFQRCDDDLSHEIQKNLISSSQIDYDTLRHYLSAAASGCCAIVIVIHQGVAYVASVGDCRAVLGVHERPVIGENNNNNNTNHNNGSPSGVFKALELNDEHNCDNINEIRRLASSHPKTEQNTIIRHNRLLGHLMPFRAFGDFCYKWPADIIKACGLTRAFGAGIIPPGYDTPPYLIAEPEVKAFNLNEQIDLDNENNDNSNHGGSQQDRYLILATDGLWELFESSRDVIETIIDHSNNSIHDEDYDANCATHILRSALCAGPYQDISLDRERMRKLYHIRLESTLTLPKSVVRNFRDDISIALLKLRKQNSDHK